MSKKEDIIITALNLFNRYNYSSVGVDRIISESGVAKMTFYKYFPSKEKLIEECLSRRNQSIQAAIQQEINLQKDDDYLGKIKAVYFWLMQLLEGFFEKAKVFQPHVLTAMYINILDGMTAYAKVNKDHTQIEECWYYIERLINLDAA